MIRRFVERLSPQGVAIFLLHGVVDRYRHALRNYNRKHLSAETFKDLVEGLTTRGLALSMDEVLNHLARRQPFPPMAFAITFDDGFANNLDVAAPILLAANLPATFYLTTSFIEANSMSWVDRIEICLEEAASGALRLPWQKDLIPFDDTASRIRLLEEIRRMAKRTPGLDLNELASDLCSQCGMAAMQTSSDPLDRKLGWDEVRRLASHSNFTIGGHSHSHAILSFLGEAALKEEISRSLKLLETKAGVQTRHYAYPEGLAHCYSEPVIAQLKAHGIQCCPTAIDGTNDHDADPFHLRRIAVM